MIPVRNDQATSEPEPIDDNASEPYAVFLQSLLEGQDARKASVEERGVAVITTSGALVALLFGLVAVLTEAENFDLPQQSRGPLWLALILFTGAAVLALLTNLPLRYANVDPQGIKKTVDDYVERPKSDAFTRIAVVRVEMYRSAKRANEVKARALFAAMVLEVAAVVSLAIAVGEIIEHGA